MEYVRPMIDEQEGGEDVDLREQRKNVARTVNSYRAT
jgi:hypothetical protein